LGKKGGKSLNNRFGIIYLMTVAETISIFEESSKLRKNLEKQGLELVGTKFVSESEMVLVTKKI